MHRPAWVSPALYPFESRFFETDDGRMHYVDQGTGHPVIMVHGTPTWSFLYRDLIARLSADYRVLAVDHLGFGLSAKPPDAPYRPVDHARRLATFVDHVDVTEFTLVVHDFGGPIGLAVALEEPDRVRRLVLFNTWLWSLRDERTVRFASRLAASPLGRLFYRWYNGSPKVLLKAAWGNTATLTDEVHRHYIQPFSAPDERVGPWTLARELLGSSAWYESLWRRREALVRKPALLAWGLDDPAFGEAVLERWERTLSNATVERLAEIGHFVPDEAADEVGPRVSTFLEDT